MEGAFDLAIIGGGINGCGIARDAAGRGLKVFLCEQDDFASGTSSKATKLIHGGLRYLEYYEFRLVREALMEREVLWRIAPHIIWPLRFVLPYHQGLRPAWMLRVGLFLYDHLGGRKLLPPTRTLDLTRDVTGGPLKPGAQEKGFEYSDCWVEDARMVVLNARDAADRGAVILPRTRAISALRGPDGWTLTVEDTLTGSRQTVITRALVNAAGPWVADVLENKLGLASKAHVRMVQGSHIVVPRLYDHDRCYIFQNADNRIIFAIPYEHDFTLIGTTDRDYHADPATVKASEEEIDYLCRAASEYFTQAVTPQDVVWTYSGVRPLYDDGASAAQAATRDYVLVLDDEAGAPLLSIFGGKITTYRRLAEHALEKLERYTAPAANAKRGWSATAALPGGDIPVLGFDAYVADLKSRFTWLDADHARRLARAYGTKAEQLLGQARSYADLGRDFGGTLMEAEVDYLMQHEWAQRAEDVLWRRSKLGLRMTAEQAEALDFYMRERERGRAQTTS